MIEVEWRQRWIAGIGSSYLGILRVMMFFQMFLGFRVLLEPMNSWRKSRDSDKAPYMLPVLHI